MSLEIKADLKQKFINWAAKPSELIVKSPGRANIIGEHTDYNEGLVLPFAISQGIYFLIAKNKHGKTKIHANDFGQTVVASTENKISNYPTWYQYFDKCLLTLKNKGHKTPQGFDLLFGGNLAIGAGVSSSSALSCGFLFTLNEFLQLGLSKLDIIELASVAENGTGVRGGQMDQHAIVLGQEKHALLLDCESKHIKKIQLPKSDLYSWVLLNTSVQHKLVNTEYNIRRAECDLALETIIKNFDQKLRFRELKLKHIKSLKNEVLRNRLMHYLQENERVRQMILALESIDINEIHSILNQSHKSLSSLYNVSCPELDFVQSKISMLGFGGRMMGGGFGGCIISYLPISFEATHYNKLKFSYQNKFQKELDILKIAPSEGIHIT